MPDVDDINQYKRAVARRLYEKRLEVLLSDINPLDTSETYFGTLRDVMAPSDTSAFPPEVLSTRVAGNPRIAALGASGMYESGDRGRDNDLISLLPQIIAHPRSPYRTLLHEAGHARQTKHYMPGASVHDLIMNSPIDPEVYADALADSLYGPRTHSLLSDADLLNLSKEMRRRLGLK